MLSRYRGKTQMQLPVTAKRLRPEAGYVKINDTSIQELVELPLDEAAAVFQKSEIIRLRSKNCQTITYRNQ